MDWTPLYTLSSHLVCSDVNKAGSFKAKSLKAKATVASNLCTAHVDSAYNNYIMSWHISVSSLKAKARSLKAKAKARDQG